MDSASIPVHLTLFPRAEASLDQCREIESNWQEFCEQFNEFAYVSEKVEAALMLPVRFSEHATGKFEKFVVDVWLATLDVDGVTPQEFDAIIEHLEKQGYKALVYSTYSHMDSIRGIGKKGEEVEPTIRARIVLPLSRPVKPNEWRFFWKAYNELFFNLADAVCKDPSRGYFVPAIHEDWKDTEEEEEFAFIFEIEGEKVVEVDWLLSSYREDIKKTNIEAELPDQKTAYSVQRELIASFARNLRRRKREDLQDLGFKMLKGLKGEIFESPGSRDTTVFKFAQELADRFPQGKVADLVEPFRPALLAMEEQEPGAPTVEQFEDKLLRAQAQVNAEKAQRVREREAKQLEEQQVEQKRIESVAEITREVIEDHQRKNDLPVDADTFPLILSHQAKYYIFDGEKYAGPYVATDLIPACRKHLEIQARGIGFSLVIVIDNGDGPPKRIPKTREQIMADYGTVCVDVLYNFEGKSYYDEDKSQLHLSDIRPCKFEPEYQPKVEHWMRTLLPIDVEYEQLCDWLSQAPNLTRALASLCFVGPADVGKSAFAAGVARLWGTPPVPMEVALDSFNGEMLNSPVLLSDEDLPRDYRGRVQTEALRRLISGGTHNINRKGIPRVVLQGFMRCIVAMNNIENFSFGRSGHSKQDIEAVQKRFLVLEGLNKDAAALFDFQEFVVEGGIAKHALWLQENRERAEQRFGVKTNSDHYVALGDTGISELLDYLSDRLFSRQMIDESNRFYDAKFNKAILIAPKRQVYLRLQSLLDDLVLHNSRRWGKTTQRQLQVMLSAISQDSERVSLKRKRNRARMWKLDLQILLRHILRTGLVGNEEFEKTLDIYHDAEFVGTMAPDPEDEASRDSAIMFLQALREDEPDANVAE